MKHFGITKKPFISYHEHNEAKRTAELVERLARGENIALITDAGKCPDYPIGIASCS
jgi:16S rRNA (cytidine1402-2'-O)-methyltransferase